MDIILDDTHVPMREVKKGEVTRLVPKTRRKYDKDEHKKIEKITRERNYLYVV